MGGLFSCCQDRVPSSLILQDHGKWVQPCDDVAKTATRFYSSHHDDFTIRATKTSDLSEFGEGHTLYFYFLKWFSFLFLFLFVLTGLPSLIFNALGGYYEDATPGIVTMGNVGGFHDVDALKLVSNRTFGKSGIEAEEAIVEFYHKPSEAPGPPAYLFGSKLITKEDALTCLSILDFIGAIIYFVTTMAIIRAQNMVAKQVNDSTVTIADYSLYVTRIPHNTKSSELREFFGRYGEVLTVELVKTDCELIACAKVRSEMADQLEVCKAVVQKAATKKPEGYVLQAQMKEIPKWEEKAERCISYTDQLLATRGDANAVCAFVTFQEETQKLAVLEAYPNSFGRRIFMSRIKRFREKYRLKVRAATEPTDVFWENLQFTSLDRSKRKAITTALKYLALSIGFFLMNVATSMKSRDTSVDQHLCDSSCQYFDASGQFSLNDTLKETYKSCWGDNSNNCTLAQKSCYGCYCAKIILNLGSEKNYCKDYISSFALKAASQAIAVSAVVAINLALTTLAMKLSSFERHHTRISEERSLAHKLFLSQFVNTVISYLVATTHVPRLKSLVQGTPVQGILFEGVFIDTTPTWYEEVGRSLTISMIAQCGVRLARVAVKYVLFKWRFWWRRTTLTQTQLNERFTGPEFELATRYGELLNLVFVAMLFGSGLPILYLVTAVSFSLQFWAEKIELLNLSKRPTAYGPDLARMAGNLLPYATLWHLVFATWSFSFYKTSRSPLVSENSAMHMEWFLKLFYWIFDGDGVQVDSAQHARRMLQRNAAHHLVGAILIGLVLIAKVTMSTWISALQQLGSFLGIIKNTDGDSSCATGYPAFSAAVESGVLVGPTSYAIKSNPKYKHALENTKGWGTVDTEVPADIEPIDRPIPREAWPMN